MSTYKKNHANIPIFIPHEGCPNSCVFCNQRTITGQNGCADRDIIPEIEKAISTLDVSSCDTEIAFFGGSFTGIDRKVMIRLLDDAYGYVKSGRVSSLRLSTRPDYIDGEILSILKERGVKTIELGIQSVSDRVLLESKRGHTAKTAENACRMITEYGFTLGGQMMIGLPESTLSDELLTAEKICEWGASECRIYPTVVFYSTELCEMAKEGKYFPLTTEEAVLRSCEVYKVFLKNNVKVLRVGLQSSENLSSDDTVFAGANHPALGELCESAIYLDIIKEKLKNITFCGAKKTLVIECPFGEVSKVSGQKKANKTAVKAFLSENGEEVCDIKIAEKFTEKFEIETKFI